MVNRDELEEAPDQATALMMATHFRASEDYDGGPACRSIFKQIERGELTFHHPDRIRMTKRGRDVLSAAIKEENRREAKEVWDQLTDMVRQ